MVFFVAEYRYLSPHTITMYKTGSEMTYVPLRTLSNAAKADLHVSFHYNALAGKWRDGVGGIQTLAGYCSKGSNTTHQSYSPT